MANGKWWLARKILGRETAAERIADSKRQKPKSWGQK
jgi:hypothetical protein